MRNGISGSMKRYATTISLIALSVAGCDDSSESDDPVGVSVPATYSFESTFNAGESSVGYGGQIYRHALIVDATRASRSLDTGISQDAFDDTSVDALAARIAYYYANDEGETALNSLPITTDPASLQSTYGDLASGRDLAGKIAGASGEQSTQYVTDWSVDFAGWDSATLAEPSSPIKTPDALVRALIRETAQNASDFANGTTRDDPTASSDEDLPSYVTVDGLDLSQLLQKFLLGAVAYSQGADDYLDDDVAGKGLLSDNTVPRDEGASSTDLEHGWDEGFGYFGAARDYADYSDAEIAGKADGGSARNTYFDTNSDGKIDLNAEYNFGHSTNAAKRDLGVASSGDRTDFTKQAYEGFAGGRELIRVAQLDGDGALTDAEFARLVQYRDDAVLAWEYAIAATVVHYINDTLGDMDSFDTDDYSFLDHAKHWSELKGFALSLQFNPRSRVQGADFVTLHAKIGMQPALPNSEASEISAYRAQLLEARDLLQDRYGFSDAQVAAW